MKDKQKRNFDRHHQATNLKPLQPGDIVLIQGNKKADQVVEQSNPRSYIVEHLEQLGLA